MIRWINIFVEWFKGMSIEHQIGLVGIGILLFVGIITFLFKKPWGHWGHRQKYKKFDNMGHEVDHPNEYYRDYYKNEN